MKYISLLLTILFYQQVALAQTIKMLNSTMQSWSGGIAGRSGVNYTFSIEFSNYKQEPIPDTLWIGRSPIALISSDASAVRVNTKRIPDKKTVRFDITCGTSADEYQTRYPNTGEAEKTRLHSLIGYKGVALLTYNYKGERQKYVITQIKTIYPPANYP